MTKRNMTTLSLCAALITLGVFVGCASTEDGGDSANTQGYEMCMDNCQATPEECEAHCSGLYQ